MSNDNNFDSSLSLTEFWKELIDEALSRSEERLKLEWMEVSTIQYTNDVNNFIQDYNQQEHDTDLRLEACPNFKACNQFLKKIHKECYQGRCLYCDITFGGNLEFVSDTYCPICLETKPNCVTWYNCTHKTCVKCFKECYNRSEQSNSQLRRCPLCRSNPIPSWQEVGPTGDRPVNK